MILNEASTVNRGPIANSYRVPGAPLFAGEYPAATPSNKSTTKTSEILDAGITAFIDLTDPNDPLMPYAATLQTLAEARGADVRYDRVSIPDMGVCSRKHMEKVLHLIQTRIDEGRVVYVHCWGGVGRTGTVIGCWLVRHGRTGTDALTEVQALFNTMSDAKTLRHKRDGSPQTEQQRSMVRNWSVQNVSATVRVAESTDQADKPVTRPLVPNAIEAWELITPREDATPEIRDRMRGALIGLAVGDAVGTTVEFRMPGTFPPVTDMVGGGPFGLAAGAWTDDTSLALCLADSLITCNGFDQRAQLERYVRWWKEGYLSSTDRCFDIGTTTSEALRNFVRTHDPLSGPTRESSAGNGSLMRLSPVPIFFFGRGDDAIALAGESSRTTHGTAVAVDACRYLAALITGALSGVSRDVLLSARYEHVAGYWTANPLHPTIAAIADGSFRRKSPPEIRGSGHVAAALEAALWAFHNSDDFRTGCLLAVNLGDDADTTAAIFGQIAGAFYGESGIPAEWRNRLARKALIDRMAETLFQLSFCKLPGIGDRTAGALAEADRQLEHANGDAFAAIRAYRDAEDALKKEMGVMAYYMNGPMHAQAFNEHLQLQLRIAAGLQCLGH